MKAKFFSILYFICLLFSATQFAQNITNTLGSGGTFSIKNGATNFFTLSQSTGNASFLKNIELGSITNSSSSVGVITKNSVRFIHNFAPAVSYGFNTFIGLNAGNFTMTASVSSQSSFNTGIGYFSLNGLTTGYSNTAIGYGTLSSNTSAYGNTAIGYTALGSNTTGFSNTAVGDGALTSNISGNANTGLGYGALLNNSTGGSNTAIGYSSLNFNSTGNSNTAIGTGALNNNSTGGGNTAVGVSALSSNTTGNNNTALGDATLIFTLGSNNTAIGEASFLNMTTGSNNTALGQNTGSTVTSGTNLTLIGYSSEPSSPTATNQITLGNNQVTALRCNVTSITSLSDVRDKKNVKDLSLGLNFLMKLKPREFNWDKREWYDNNLSDGSKMQKTKTAGFIAQELDTVQTEEHAGWLNLVMKDNPDKWEATYGNLLPVMVKSIQALKQENDNLKEENKKQNDRIARLEQIINKLDRTGQLVKVSGGR